MKISKYVKEYTSGKYVPFKGILSEIGEVGQAIGDFNLNEIKEEIGDVFHFIQLWLFWRFGINGELWKITKGSTDKFMARRKAWVKLYEHVGLDKDVSHFCGNYKKIEKVIKHLGEFGISEKRAREAYAVIVDGKTK